VSVREESRDRPRFPPWMRKPIPRTGNSQRVVGLLDDLALNTVCRSAHCPNLTECFARGTATFMILGDTCTRDCRFCAVRNGDPAPPRPDEPPAVALAAAKLELSHVVITSVTRDDLGDGGAAHFAATIAAVRRRVPQGTIEVLTPDFRGDVAALDVVLSARPDVFNHNIETVGRLYPLIRPQGDYARSLDLLARAGEYASDTGLPMRIKSGLMVGLGETDEEVCGVLEDLRRSGVEIVTVGQYLAPSAQHAPIKRFVRPEQYETWRKSALDMGFSAVAAGPYVRSSYHAESLLRSAGRSHGSKRLGKRVSDNVVEGFLFEISGAVLPHRALGVALQPADR